MAASWGLAERLRILGTREYQVSIRESFHAEIAKVISERPWLAAHYVVTEKGIYGRNGTEFIFRGLRKNIASIRSLSSIDLVIIEEAENVPERSIQALLPTVRNEKSEVWAIWNPEREDSPIDGLLRKHCPPNALVAELNYWDNPFFTAVLEEQRRHDQARLDPQTYSHIWEGDYLRNSASQVLAGKVRVDEFAPGSDWSGPYYGLDWGFAQDPTAALRCWVHDSRLWIEYEAGRVGLEIDVVASYLTERVPGIASHVVRADSARPENISYVARNGLPRIVAVDKWPNSVADGIAHLRSYKEIVVHPRCRETIRETRLYSYKVDKLTGDVLPIVVDAFNHYIDAARYAIAPLIRYRNVNAAGAHVPGL